MFFRLHQKEEEEERRETEGTNSINNRCTFKYFKTLSSIIKIYKEHL